MTKRIDQKRLEQGRRLKEARIAAGFKSARDTALKCGWPESTYRAHETATRKMGEDDAERYAKRFRHEGVNVTAMSILFGNQTPSSRKSGDRVSLDQMVEDWSDEDVSRAAEALKLLRPRHP